MAYKTKFSGVKDTYRGGGTRDSQAGRGRFDLITPFFLKRLAGVYERGAVNHGSWNWTKGMPFSRLVNSALRHLNQYRSGSRDEDHLAQAAWQLATMIHFEEVGRTDLDDLPRFQCHTSKKKPERPSKASSKSVRKRRAS